MVRGYLKKIKNIGLEKILLIFLAGILLVFSGGNSKTVKNNTNINKPEYESTKSTINITANNNLEKKLTDIISMISGVNSVNVAITYSDNGEKILVCENSIDKEYTNQNESNGSNLITESINTTQDYLFENDTPYAVKEVAPKVCGVVVVYSGDKSINKDIADAVKVLTDVEYNKIKVLSVN